MQWVPVNQYAQHRRYQICMCMQQLATLLRLLSNQSGFANHPQSEKITTIITLVKPEF